MQQYWKQRILCDNESDSEFLREAKDLWVNIICTDDPRIWDARKMGAHVLPNTYAVLPSHYRYIRLLAKDTGHTITHKLVEKSNYEYILREVSSFQASTAGVKQTDSGSGASSKPRTNWSGLNIFALEVSSNVAAVDIVRLMELANNVSNLVSQAVQSCLPVCL
jgi:hypothetical protein